MKRARTTAAISTFTLCGLGLAGVLLLSAFLRFAFRDDEVTRDGCDTPGLTAELNPTQWEELSAAAELSNLCGDGKDAVEVVEERVAAWCATRGVHGKIYRFHETAASADIALAWCSPSVLFRSWKLVKASLQILLFSQVRSARCGFCRKLDSFISC